MADRFILSQIKRYPLFDRLTSEQLEQVANAAQVLRFEPGETVFGQGQPIGGLLMFVSGQGELIQTGSDGIQRSAGLVTPGEYFQENALFAEATAPVTLRVVETAIVVYLARAQMAALTTYQPDIRQALGAPSNGSTQALSPEEKVFHGQRDNEAVLLETRHHWWAFLRRVWLTLLGFVVLLVLLGGASSAMPGFPSLLIIALAFPVIAVLVGYYYLEWQNDKLIITERRVVNIHRQIIGFRTAVNELPLDGINEINVITPRTDPLAYFFGYGTIILRTSGDTKNLKLDFIPNPRNIQDVIFAHRKQLQDAAAAMSRQAHRNAIRAEIDNLIGGKSGELSQDTGANPAIPLQKEAGFLSTRYTNEKGETVYRKHRIVWLRSVVLPGVVTIIGLILFFAVLFGFSGFPQLGFVGFALAMMVIAIGAVWAYTADWDWRNDMYIVGDELITIIHKRPLWLEDQHDQIALAQVDNVVSETSGLLNSLLNIGSLKILLTGTNEQNAKYFRSVHDPRQIQEEISRRKDRGVVAKQAGDAQRQRQAIVEYLSVYHESVAPEAQAAASSPIPIEQPPRVRDRTRPPGIPLVRRDDPPQ